MPRIRVPRPAQLRAADSVFASVMATLWGGLLPLLIVVGWSSGLFAAVCARSQHDRLTLAYVAFFGYCGLTYGLASLARWLALALS